MTSKEKLQEVWNLIHNKYPDNNEEIQKVRYAVKLAMDLVERDTPVKIVDTGIGGSYCKKCRKSKHYDSFGNRNNFCGGCGQKLLW